MHTPEGRPNLLSSVVDRPHQNGQNARQCFSPLVPNSQRSLGNKQSQLSSRRKSVNHSKKFLPFSGTLALCCLALTGALALAQNANNKTTVRYPTGYAVSSPLRELPIDILAMENREMPEPRSLPMGSKKVGPWQQDAALQT